MNGTLIGSYPKNGKTIFKYAVKGTAEEIENFKALQGQFLRFQDDDATKAPLWFTPTCTGKFVELKVSAKGTVFPDNGQLNALKSLANHMQGPIGDAIGAELAKKLIAEMQFTQATQSAPVQDKPEPLAQQDEPVDKF